jgi:ubiquinol-cytochrome c reductase cytochrome b subunit/menaquinol-cytochrome c reductase cytochrome b/c subunit
VASDDKRHEFELYKKDVERRGKPFFPYAMFHDTVMSFVVVMVIIGLAALWYFTSGEEAGDAGVLGPRYTEEADPGTTSFTPRPDWYFYFLFYLLRIFKWPESVFLGTVGIPTIALILLILVPFYDRRRERRIARRPVAVVAALLVIASMGVLTYKGATAEEASGEAPQLAEEWTQAQGLSQQASQGALLFAQSGCLSCHTYEGTGGTVGPELTQEGTRGRGKQWQIEHLMDPQSKTPGSSMPAFTDFTDQQYDLLATFLEESGTNGGG